jgi:hypothetical protein
LQRGSASRRSLQQSCTRQAAPRSPPRTPHERFEEFAVQQRAVRRVGAEGRDQWKALRRAPRSAATRCRAAPVGRTRCSTPFDVAIVKPAPREPRIPHEAPPLPRREAARAVREALAEEERQHGVAVVDLAQLAVPAKEHAVQPLRRKIVE